MPPADSSNIARADGSREGETLVLRLGGDWRVTEHHPVWADTMTGDRPQRVVLQAEGLGTWDSSLALFLSAARVWSVKHGVELVEQGLPKEAGRLADLLVNRPAVKAKRTGVPELVTGVGEATVKVWAEAKDLAQLVGECLFSSGRFFRGQAQFRWRDCFSEMQQCGAMALPIVGLISFLVGVIMAYQGAVQLRQFGADIYVADLVGLSVVREMGPMMAAIVLAGRTGAAFAATLGNMQANEEIDALETLGVSPVDFLVMPRITALFLMMPLLALYSNFLGIMGGLAVSSSILDIPASLYWVETKSIIDLSDLSTGLIKAAVFGLIIGLSACLRGLQAERSATGAGQAATSAVVTSTLLIIVVDSIFAVIFNILGW
jgi:phospholipid/cholesterol/gamma-HCH transport system permease protein